MMMFKITLVVVTDPTYETTEMSTREVAHPVYAELQRSVCTEIVA